MSGERKLYQKFKDKMRKADPSSWVYKIPDTFNLGGKKPGDFFCVVQGVPFLLEFKGKNGILSKYQAFQLTDFIAAGGEALAYWGEQMTMDQFVKVIIEKAKEKGGEKR